MRKLLRLFNIISLVTTISILPIACTNPVRASYDISKINFVNSKAFVARDKEESYYQVLESFRKDVEIEISNILPFDKEPEFNYDYKIIIKNHDIFATVSDIGLIEITIIAIEDKNLFLKGSFHTSVTLLDSAKTISELKIDQQNFKVTPTPTASKFENVINTMYPIVSHLIETTNKNARYKIDYTINVEGYYPSELITKLSYGENNINVNAINNEQHNLLCGSFSFKVIIS